MLGAVAALPNLPERGLDLRDAEQQVAGTAELPGLRGLLMVWSNGTVAHPNQRARLMPTE